MSRPFWRLLVICFAWSLGAVLAYAFGGYAFGGYAFGAYAFDTLISALFAFAAFVFTRDDGYSSRGGGGRGDNVKYWRGRRVDDRPPRRWN